MIYGMRNVNVQVRLPDDLDQKISRIASRSKSSFIREAIEEKIARERKKRLEEQWIQALQGHPEDEREAESWFQREDWGPK